MANPKIQQGVINRVRSSLIVPSNTALNATAPYLSKSMINVEFEGNFVEQIETATGAVRSPEPFVMATITMGLLRSQSLSATWLNQVQNNSFLGDVTAHSDSSVYPAISLSETVVRMIRNGAFDGADPVVAVVLRGIYYVNNDLWNAF
jgi:hypothetical protein